jgi:regulator of sirC expression with transglutaminase-like and TPR domain
MSAQLPLPVLLAPPTPLAYFASLVAEDESFALLEAAVSLAQDDDPGLDAQGVLAEVDALADRLRRRIPADTAPLLRVRLLNRYFFQELGFAGNVNNYYDRRNSYLPDVLHTRRGIPITLALLYMELAGQIGVRAHGVAFPGHFLVKLHLGGGGLRGDVVIDPFNGRSLTREELEEWLLPYRRQQGLTDDDEAPLGLFLRRAQPRTVIARMLHNLKEIHRSARDWPRLVAVLDRLVILLPDAWAERRDRAIAQAELGRTDLAADDLAAYLEHLPEAPDAPSMRALLRTWRRAPRPRLQ